MSLCRICNLQGHEFLNIVRIQARVILFLLGRVVNWQELQHNQEQLKSQKQAKVDEDGGLNRKSHTEWSEAEI